MRTCPGFLNESDFFCLQMIKTIWQTLHKKRLSGSKKYNKVFKQQLCMGKARGNQASEQQAAGAQIPPGLSLHIWPLPSLLTSFLHKAQCVCLHSHLAVIHSLHQQRTDSIPQFQFHNSQGKMLIGCAWARYLPLNQSTVARWLWSCDMCNFPQNHRDGVKVWAVSRK